MNKRTFIFFLVGCAFLVGTLYVAPQLLIWKHLSGQNEAYLMSQFGDEITAYIPSAHEVYDGHFPPADYFFDDLKVSLFPPLPPLIFASFLFLLRGDVQLTYLLVIFLFSGIIFLLYYLLGRKVFQHGAWAVFFGFFCVLTTANIPYAFFSPGNFLNIVGKNFIPLVQTPIDRLALVRFDEPLLTMPFLLATILSLFLFWREPGRKSALRAGALVGLLFYIYFHYWVYVVVVAGSLLLLALVTHKKDVWRLKCTLLLNAVYAVFSVPYFINQLAFSRTAGYNDFIHRVGIRMHEGRFFDFADYRYYIAYGVLALIIYALWFNTDRKRAELYFVFLFASFVVLNVQVVTGFVPEPDHWVKVLHVVASLMAIDCLAEIVKRLFSAKKILVVLVVLSFLLVGKKIINATYFINPPADVLPYYTFNQDIIDSWVWISNTLPHEPKIISPSFLTTDYLTSYTSARPYLPTGVKTLTTNKILEERFLTAYKLFNVSPETLRSRLTARPVEGNNNNNNWKTPDLLSRLNADIPASLYYNYYTRDFGGSIPDQKVKELLGRYYDLNITWASIDADYVYIGPFERALVSADFGGDGNFQLLFKNSSVEIYKIIKKYRHVSRKKSFGGHGNVQ